MVAPQTPRPSAADAASRKRGFRRVVVFLSFVFACVIASQLWHAWQLHRNTIGDGRTVASYGYDLSKLTVPADLVVASGLPRDGRLTLLNPKPISVEEVDELNSKYAHQGRWRRIVVPSDIVIGVEFSGEARAYPLRYMRWHWIVNDTLGDAPVAVTYDPLCAAAAVFDRRMGEATLELGFSGLLYNSNLLMYDRKPGRADESLWSQLLGKPVAGPAVSSGEPLTILPVFVGRFEAWRKAYPHTTVFAGEERLKNVYDDNSFEAYYRKGKPNFTVRPEPPPDGPFKPFDTVVASEGLGGWEVRAANPDEESVSPDDARASIFCLWFAWHAIRGGD